jgi:transposase-like protein
MTKKRKKHAPAFRASAVKLITEQGCWNAEAARNFGINRTRLGRWKRELEDSGVPQILAAPWMGFPVCG